jgi:LPS export ABC transporter permease LptF
MRAPRTLTAYLLREVAIYTLIGLAAIIVVLVTRNLVRTLGELVDAGFGWPDLVVIVRLLGTMLLIHALPIAFLFGVLLAVGRMAADVEITAMRACGIGLRTLATPILALGLLLSLVTLRLTLEAEPEARREMRAVIKLILARGGVIEPGRFRRFGDDRLCFVEQRDVDDTLRGIVCADHSTPERPFIVFAESGRITLDEATSELVMELRAGDIHLQERSDGDRYQRIAFERFRYGVDVEGLVGKRGRKPKEMTMRELEQALARIAAGDTSDGYDPVDFALQWHRRIAAPFAPALFALVAVPIAMRRTRGARSLGMLWCGVLAFGYYLVQSFSEFLSAQGLLAPVAACWIANASFAAIGVALLQRARRAGM